MSDPIVDRANDLTDDYCQQLDVLVNGIVPPMLGNAEYAARCSALMIALNRQLARCAASFGEVHEIAFDEMTELVVAQFIRNFSISRQALEGQGAGRMVS